MTPQNSIMPREAHVPPKPVPIGGDTMSVIVSLASVSVLSIFLYQRITAVRSWARLPFVAWLVLIIYVDSYGFVFTSAILTQVFGLNTSFNICHGAIILCLVCYVTTKILIYVFLVEKAHVIRSSTTRRRNSGLYLFNIITLLVGYGVVVVMNFVFRIARIVNGECFIGMEKISMIPLIAFDAVVNVYLTILFLIPLKNLYSFKNLPKTGANSRLRSVAMRTFVGACCTLTSSIVNLSVLMVLNGEPGWVCLMCCNSDVLFSAIVVQWVTSRDNAGSSSQVNSAALDNSYVGRQSSAAHQMSSMRASKAPNNSHDMDDEANLVSSGAVAFSSDNGSDVTKVSSGVVVTTTIHRQIKPTPGREGCLLDDDIETIGESDRDFPLRPAVYSPDKMDACEPTQTHIQGGRVQHQRTKTLSFSRPMN
ncbi:unnamed protein product [Fusarium graminearum]|uniref:Uncharacterized protein n=1 Tax=Gibberella zeae TaxID=5518 RepID=A0A4E9EFB5_GIBZA|nr:hypothetical protein FG05_00315 [Fusarium graminearum]KAI6761981.1 hypothetical protein HG531_002534 [Fusarium graminearum]CAF3502219.1 unnamed protein product [Fusarium graminearum]CAG1986232.1 unnamed protein product [Fusarium graminearum]CAG2002306.1 unnamed protein product [Fusarium graminearum]